MPNLSVVAIIICVACSALVSAPAGWFARGVIFDRFERPAIIHEQEVFWTAEIKRTADKALADEQLRQFRIGEAATEQFMIEQKASDDMNAAERARQETEIVTYEHKLLETRRICGLDGDDLDFLGVQFQHGGPVPSLGTKGPGGSQGVVAAPTR